MYRFDTPTAQLRSVASIEGISYLLLLFVAMPLKYLAGMPLAEASNRVSPKGSVSAGLTNTPPEAAASR